MASRVVRIPVALADAVVVAAGEAGVEDFVVRAIEARLGNVEMSNLLDELAEETGPIPEALLAEAEAFWQAS